MRRTVISAVATILLLSLLLSSCVKTEGFADKKSQQHAAPANTSTEAPAPTPSAPTPAEQEPTITNISYNEEPSPAAANESTQQEPQEQEPEKPQTQNRIDATTRSNGADVIADFDGVVKKFSVADNDHDAIVFDIAQNLGKGIKEIRPLVYINGVPYLRPSELKKAQERLSQKEAATFDPTTIPITATKDDGFIRGVGCDLSKKYIRLDLTNPTDKPITIFKNKDTFPRVKDALALFLDKRLLSDVSCSSGAYTFAAHDNFTCVKANVIFLAVGSQNAFETNASYDTRQPDEVGVVRPGYRENLLFHCKEPAPLQNNTREQNQTLTPT